MDKWHIGETCENCGGKVMKIMWGMPSLDGALEAERKGWYVGGCCIDDRVSRCECGVTGYDRDGNPVYEGFEYSSDPQEDRTTP